MLRHYLELPRPRVLNRLMRKRMREWGSEWLPIFPASVSDRTQVGTPVLVFGHVTAIGAKACSLSSLRPHTGLSLWRNASPDCSVCTIQLANMVHARHRTAELCWFSWAKHTPVAPSVGFSWAAWHTLVEDISTLILEERISVSSLIPQPQYTLKLRSDFCSSVPPLDSLGEDGSCLKNFLSSFNFRNSYFSPPPQPLLFLLQTIISRTSLEWKRIISYISTV